jgi:hypothetical protein
MGATSLDLPILNCHKTLELGYKWYTVKEAQFLFSRRKPVTTKAVVLKRERRYKS